jgi:[ribosomal protein S18]-alanine N-acetyltransferase
MRREVHVRWGINRDLDRMVEIDRAVDVFEAWTREDFVSRGRNRNCIVMVAEVDGEVLGYVVYFLLRGKLLIERFAVDPSHRRQGIATEIFAKLKSKISPNYRRDHFTLWVPDDNLGCHLFLRSQGLKAVSVAGDAYQFMFSIHHRQEVCA